jgi:uncharacterized protein YacL (UPF0231 family)
LLDYEMSDRKEKAWAYRLVMASLGALVHEVSIAWFEANTDSKSREIMTAYNIVFDLYEAEIEYVQELDIIVDAEDVTRQAIGLAFKDKHVDEPISIIMKAPGFNPAPPLTIGGQGEQTVAT